MSDNSIAFSNSFIFNYFAQVPTDTQVQFITVATETGISDRDAFDFSGLATRAIYTLVALIHSKPDKVCKKSAP
ncbi:hypothetical protein BZG00_04135 [Salinivibrio kushneri]|uniref:MarR family transcriptional regulator n=1 Tax=Salinivibrio kushneri TaxID=1908198 RepID=A0AB36JYC8_9GAMM|nr:hypothetical protein BZG00_04135 [Salinivibrio kushneri]